MSSTATNAGHGTRFCEFASIGQDSVRKRPSQYIFMDSCRLRYLLTYKQGVLVLHAFNRVPSISCLASLTRKLERMVSCHCFFPRESKRFDPHLYHHTVGPTVPKCQRLCASIIPPRGGKSSSSRLMASTSHATIRPGHAAHGFFSFR